LYLVGIPGHGDREFRAIWPRIRARVNNACTYDKWTQFPWKIDSEDFYYVPRPGLVAGQLFCIAGKLIFEKSLLLFWHSITKNSLHHLARYRFGLPAFEI
jgi:hypothetical protein